ncbi:MAG: hypothetical protein II187_07245 [Treponema sp.]|nr:hypothetical protein [Treponema sp.]
MRLSILRQGLYGASSLIPYGGLKLYRIPADMERMNTVAFIPLIKQVLMDWRVIFITVAMVLIVSIAKYVVNYRKKPVVVKRRTVVKKAPPPPAPAEGAEEGAAAAEE